MDVRLEDVWYTYDGVNYALSSVNLELNSSGLYLLVGPNGSGKTTLLKLIALLLKPSRGRILINGINPWDQKASGYSRDGIVYVHDRPLTVKGDVEYNITLGLRLRGLEGARDTVDYFIEKYGLSDIRRRDVKSLSAGNRRIVSLLRAIIIKPKILLLDEPFTHLDQKRVELLIEDLKEFSHDTMIVMATHYLYKGILEYTKERYEIVAGRLRKI